MKHENVNREEEYQGDGDTAMQDQNNRMLVQNHAEQACSEGNHNQCKQQQSFYTQFLSVDNCVNDAEQQK